MSGISAISRQVRISLAQLMQLNLWQVLVLAVVQGVTEFLPVSSDGHLVAITPWLTGGKSLEDNAVVVILHVGTLASILVYYFRPLLALITRDRRTLALIIIGSIPAGVAGLVFDEIGQGILNNPLLASLFLPVTGIIVLFAARAPVEGKEYVGLTWPQVLAIGFAQAAAILPGISRSGCTIAAGLGAGLSRKDAATFSFLLGAPIIGAACLWKVLKLITHEPPETPASLMAVGAFVSFVVGLLALHWLMRWVERGKLHYFGWYCIGLGLLLSVWQIYALLAGGA